MWLVRGIFYIEAVFNKRGNFFRTAAQVSKVVKSFGVIVKLCVEWIMIDVLHCKTW